METPVQLATRFREVILNGKWIANTNYKEILWNVTWQQANTQIGPLNTIAALTYHINYYIAGILDFFESSRFEIHDRYSFNHPPVKSEDDWKNLLDDLWANAERFARHIELMSDEKLGEIFVKKEYGTYRRNIEAIIEHSYYHLGQISLIKKLMLE